MAAARSSTSLRSPLGRAARSPHTPPPRPGAVSLTQSQASELGPHNINVNAVCPGLLWTDMWRKLEGMLIGDDTEEVVDRRAAFETAVANNMPPRPRADAGRHRQSRRLLRLRRREEHHRTVVERRRRDADELGVARSERLPVPAEDLRSSPLHNLPLPPGEACPALDAGAGVRAVPALSTRS